MAGGLPNSVAAMVLGDGTDVVEDIIGGPTTESVRVRLDAPATFPNGATVPVRVDVDTPMTMADHVRRVRLFAPRNPFIEIMDFSFVPDLSLPVVSTRIRLSEPQYVIAIAEMNDGAFLLAKSFVEVATNGCPDQ
jgi:sulfur-oxidizing protein SoxY